MKTLRKYANMTLLLLSVATIVPAYASLEDKYSILKEKMIQQSKRPEVMKKIVDGLEVAVTISGITLCSIVFGILTQRARIALGLKFKSATSK